MKTKYLIPLVLASVITGVLGTQASAHVSCPVVSAPSVQDIWNSICELQAHVDNLQSQIDNIQLIPGPQGPQGIQGIQGPQGQQGPSGPQGQPGEPALVFLSHRSFLIQPIGGATQFNITITSNSSLMFVESIFMDVNAPLSSRIRLTSMTFEYGSNTIAFDHIAIPTGGTIGSVPIGALGEPTFAGNRISYILTADAPENNVILNMMPVVRVPSNATTTTTLTVS